MCGQELGSSSCVCFNFLCFCVCMLTSLRKKMCHKLYIIPCLHPFLSVLITGLSLYWNAHTSSNQQRSLLWTVSFLHNATRCDLSYLEQSTGRQTTQPPLPSWWPLWPHLMNILKNGPWDLHCKAHHLIISHCDTWPFENVKTPKLLHAVHTFVAHQLLCYTRVHKTAQHLNRFAVSSENTALLTFPCEPILY